MGTNHAVLGWLLNWLITFSHDKDIGIQCTPSTSSMAMAWYREKKRRPTPPPAERPQCHKSRHSASSANAPGSFKTCLKAFKPADHPHSSCAGVGRLVAEAQSREVPLQRVADTVAGKFCYTVMASSAVTFAFWALAGAP